MSDKDSLTNVELNISQKTFTEAKQRFDNSNETLESALAKFITDVAENGSGNVSLRVNEHQINSPDVQSGTSRTESWGYTDNEGQTVNHSKSWSTGSSSSNGSSNSED